MPKLLPSRRAMSRAIFLSLMLAAGPMALCNEAVPASASSASAFERAFTRGDPVPAWIDRIAAKPAPSSGHALSIVLADLHFRAGEGGALYQHRALTAHESSSLGALGQYDIEFQPAYQRVQLHRLAVLRAGQVIDKLASADIRFLQRERGLEQGLVDGSVTAQIVTTDVRVGDTLDIEFSVLGQNPVFGGHFMDSAQWDYPSPVQLRRVTVDAPANVLVDYKLMASGDGPLPRQSASERDGRRRLRFEAAAMAPVLGEGYVPHDVHQYRWLQFSDFHSWAEVNSWALELFSATTPASVLDGPLRTARAAKTQDEAVAKVLEFVQNDIRYLSVSLGENSHRPFPPATVLERRYGDCKDKTLLAVAMLRALGIEAEPVLVASTMVKGLDQMLPSPTLFDHAIVHVTVGGKSYYLDPTRLGQYGQLERMGQSHGGRQVLVVKPGTTALAEIPEAAREFVTSRRSERATVNDFGKPAEFVETIDMAGVSAESTRVQLARMSKQELRKAYEGALVKRYPDAQLVGEPRVRDDRVRNTLAIEVHYSIASLLTPNDKGDGWDLRYSPTNLTELFAPPGNARRSFALALPAFPYAFDYDFQLTLPAGYDIGEYASTRTVDDPAFRLARKLDSGKRNMHVKLLLETRADRVAPGRLPQYLKNTQQYNEMLGGTLHIPKEAPTAARPVAARKLAAEARLEQSLLAMGRVIDDADATGRDPSASLCERALALAYLGRKPDAHKDLARALQLQPQSDALLRCRAEVHFIVGRFKESEADFSRAMARGADQSQNFLGRGLAWMYLNKMAAAQADFQVAIAKADDDAQRQRAAILLRIAGGTPGAPAGEAESSWLAQADAMFAGTVEPEHMVSAATRGLVEGNNGPLVEAYYYAGRYHLAKGNALKARVYFQRALDKRLLDNPYHVAAQHELARVPSPP
ncbi:MAG: DUF3857 domain-containing protein [Pseudomonadota bacterium]